MLIDNYVKWVIVNNSFPLWFRHLKAIRSAMLRFRSCCVPIQRLIEIIKQQNEQNLLKNAHLNA